MMMVGWSASRRRRPPQEVISACDKLVWWRALRRRRPRQDGLRWCGNRRCDCMIDGIMVMSSSARRCHRPRQGAHDRRCDGVVYDKMVSDGNRNCDDVVHGKFARAL
ncbi:hypothetical protein VPH35_053770 [Triticum aestivum]